MKQLKSVQAKIEMLNGKQYSFNEEYPWLWFSGGLLNSLTVLATLSKKIRRIRCEYHEKN